MSYYKSLVQVPEDFDLSRWSDREQVWIQVAADCGGIEAFACPVSPVRVSPHNLIQLIADLESVCWNSPISSDRRSPSIDIDCSIIDDPPTQTTLIPGHFVGFCWMGLDILEAGLGMEVLGVLEGKAERINVENYNLWLKSKYPVKFRSDLQE